MNLNPNSGSVAGRVVLLCGAITAGAGALALVGWALGSDTLTAMGTGYIPMAPNTALLFALLGSAVLVRELWPANWMIHRAVAAAAIVSALVGCVTLAGFVTGLNIDEWLFRSTRMVGAVPIGRMSFFTALCFVLAGVSLWLSERQAKTGAAVLGILVALAGTVCLTGYWFGSPLFYGGNLIPVALPTSLALVALGVALIAAARPDPWPLNALIGALTLAVFALDWLTPLGYAEWLLYLIPLLLTKWTQRRRSPVVVAAICSVLVAVGFFLSPPGIDLTIAIFNRALGVAVLWITAVLLALRKRTEEDIRQRNRELAAIGDLIAATATTLDLQAVLDRALRGAMELTGMEGGTICTVDPERQSLELAAHVNTSPETIRDLTTNVIKVGDCLCGQCARTCEPLILWDNASGSAFATREATRNEGIRFHAAFPLLVAGSPERGQPCPPEGASSHEPAAWNAAFRRPPAGSSPQRQPEGCVPARCIGVLCVFARSDRKPAQRSLDLVHDLCGPVALAIENARLFDAKQRELEERKRAESLLGIQKQVLEMIASGAALAETLTALVRLIESQAPGMLGSVLLLDEDGVHVRHGAAPGLPPEYVAAIDGQPIGPCAGSCGTAAYRKEPVFVEDIATDPLWAAYKAATLPHGLRACWSTPIFDAQRRVLGTFAMYYRQPGLPQPEHRRLIDIATHTAAIAISRHRTEAALRAKTEELNRYFTNSLDLLCIADTDGYFRRLNPEWERTLGYPLGELEGRRFLDLVHPEDVAATLAAVEKLSSQEHVLDFVNRYRHKDGSYRWLEWRSYAEDGRIYAVARDITEHKEAEAALRGSEESFRSLFENMLEGVAFCRMIFDDGDRPADFVYLKVNRSFERLTGLTNVVGKKETEVFPGVKELHPEMFEVFGRVALTGKPEQFEIDFKPLKQVFFLSVYSLEKGHCILIFDNITARKQAEESLRQSEELFSTTFHVGPAGMTITRVADGKFINVNDAFLRLFEFSHEEAIGHTSTELNMLCPEERDQLIQQQRESGGLRNAELRAKTKSGRLVNLLFSSKPMQVAGEECHLTTLIDITERKQAEAALRASEANYRTLMESASDGIFIVDARGRLVDANVLGCRMLHYTHEEILGLGIADIVPAKEAARVAPEFGRLKAGEVVLSEWQFRRKDGTRFPGEVSATVLPDGRLLGILRDITERKQAEAALRASEERLRHVLDGLGPQMFAGLLDPQGTVLLANRPAMEAATLRSEEVIGRPVESTYWWTWSEAVSQRLRAAVERAAQGEPVRYDEQIRVAEGQLIWLDFSIQPLRDETGSIRFLIPSGLVITERKQAEAVVRESEERFRTAFDDAPAGMCLTSPEGRFLRVNHALCRLLNYGEPDLLGKGFAEITHPDDLAESRDAVGRLLAGEVNAADFEKRYLRRDGQVVWAAVRTVLVREADRRPLYFVTHILDITARKEAEAALRLSSEQLRALTQRLQSAREEEARRIARELHDELGQMLTGLKMDLRWVERDLEEGETSARTNTLLEKVVAASELVDGTTKTVQRIAAELRSGLLDKLGLAMALRHESQQFQQRTGVVCRLRVPEPEPQLSTDAATACYRVCQEALTNVTRHAAASEVEIELREEGGGAEEQRGGAWVLEVRDNGKGIAADKLTDPHSLGLIGMQERAAALGGHVTFRHQPGGGTVVAARIPCAEKRC